MAGLGPWPLGRKVAVAVSGGADSLCLAWLAAGWGCPLGLIVDHGLRPESAAEASLTQTRLAGFGVPSRILRLNNLLPGPGLAARARQARYAALTDAAQDAGLSDVLLGHHAGDQAETLLLRRAANSGESGLAGMARVVESTSLRLVRPLLHLPKSRLQATLRAAGVGWVEDPSNHDAATARAGARTAIGEPGGDGHITAGLIAQAHQAGLTRAMADLARARVLAERAVIRPEGFALLTPGPIDQATLSAVIRALTGCAYPPRRARLTRLAAGLAPGVLAGLRILPAGKLGTGWIMAREVSAMQAPVPARPNALWDRRFHLGPAPHLPDGTSLGAVGADAATLRRHTDLPACILQTLPALRVQGRLVAVPHIGYATVSSLAGVAVVFSPPNPASGAPFGV